MSLPPIDRLADPIDRITAAVGRIAVWCILFVAVMQFVLVLLRYVLGVGSIALQESILYAHAALFMLVAAWTLQQGGHVRVDIFYAGTSPRRRALIDLAGTLLLLLPLAVAILVFSLPYVWRAWSILERSREAGGLPLVYLLKSLIPLFALLLALQGIAQAIRAARILFAAAPAGTSR